jgi:ABC-type sugar transport system permease subunit
VISFQRNKKKNTNYALIVIMLFLSLLHVALLSVRSSLRSCNNHKQESSIEWLGFRCNDTRTTDTNHVYEYSSLTWEFWIVSFIITPIIGIIVGDLVNQHDFKFYRRHLQFLRLEFDTRLGMHSPR